MKPTEQIPAPPKLRSTAQLWSRREKIRQQIVALKKEFQEITEQLDKDIENSAL